MSHDSNTFRGDCIKILLAADGSAYTKRMLAYVAAHDEWLADRHQYVVLVGVPGTPSRAASMLDRETLKGFYRDEAEKVFKPIRAFFKQRGIQAEFVSRVGPPGDVIATQATSSSFDLLMMGSHGHGSVVNV